MANGVVLFRISWASAILAVLWGSLTPTSLPTPDIVINIDKVIHAGAYMLLTVLGALAIQGRNDRRIALASMIFFGWGIEVLQSYVPGRDCSVADGLANMLGGGAGYLAAPAVQSALTWVAAARGVHCITKGNGGTR